MVGSVRRSGIGRFCDWATQRIERASQNAKATILSMFRAIQVKGQADECWSPENDEMSDWFHREFD